MLFEVVPCGLQFWIQGDTACHDGVAGSVWASVRRERRGARLMKLGRVERGTVAAAKFFNRSALLGRIDLF